jgi:hypothetical protein
LIKDALKMQDYITILHETWLFLPNPLKVKSKILYKALYLLPNFPIPLNKPTTVLPHSPRSSYNAFLGQVHFTSGPWCSVLAVFLGNAFPRYKCLLLLIPSGLCSNGTFWVKFS